jgi:SAM-dependent methyltransferase
MYKPNAKNILDVGCGTGMHALNLAEMGYTIYGIDQSNEMISIANDQLFNKPLLFDHVKFLIGDLRNLEIGKYFDVVVSLFHVMSYQITNNELVNSINSIANHTKKGSLVIFDCWYGPAVLTDKPNKRTKTFEDSELLVKRIAIPVIYPSKNLVDVNFNITVINKDSGNKQTFDELHQMRYLFEPEMELILRDNNFNIIKTEEWMTGNNPSFDTWYVTFICEKL